MGSVRLGHWRVSARQGSAGEMLRARLDHSRPPRERLRVVEELTGQSWEKAAPHTTIYQHKTNPIVFFQWRADYY